MVHEAMSLYVVPELETVKVWISVVGYSRIFPQDTNVSSAEHVPGNIPRPGVVHSCSVFPLKGPCSLWLVRPLLWDR